MFKIKKTFEISAEHSLRLPYPSKCSRNHGHNFLLTIYCASDGLDENGMVVDFTEIKKKILDILDHRNLNAIEGLGFVGSVPCLFSKAVRRNPTAERIAYWIYERIEKCYRVDVQESDGNVATYIDDTVRI